MLRCVTQSVVLLAMAILGAGCALDAGGKNPLQQKMPLVTDWDTPLANRAYRIQVGDRIAVRFLYASDLNDEVVVRSDGRISLVPIDDVEVAGLTPEQLDAKLTAQFAKVVNQPDLTVIMREFAAQRVFVGGEVTSAQMMQLTSSNMSVLTAIVQAGGVLNTGALDSVLLIRRGEGNECYVKKVNLKKVLKDGQGDIRLAAYDVIYVPRTNIADVGLFVEQYVNSIVPRALGFTFLYNINASVQIKQ